MSEEKITYKVEFEVRTTVVYEVEALHEDEAIKRAIVDAKLDHDSVDFLDVWEK